MGITVKRTKTDNIWLFDYTSLLGLSAEQDKLLFLSERDLNLIYQGLKDIDRFITRVFVSVTGNMYTSVDNDQFEIFKQWQSDLFNHMGDWRMTNEILVRIAEAVEALEGAGCGCASIEGSDSGSGGAGTAPADPSGIVTDDEARQGPPPPGFSTWEERDQYACDMANYIFDQLLIDVATASTIAIGGFGAIELAGLLVSLLITPIGWVALLGVAAIMIQATILTISYSLIISHLEDNRDDYICSILAGTDVASSISEFSSKVDELLPADTGFTDPVSSYVASNFVKSFASIDSFNRLYAKIVVDMPAGDCSACAEELIWSINTLICTPTQISGIFTSGSSVELGSCEGNYFGTTRAGINCGAQPVSTLERDLVVTAVTGGGSFYVGTRTGGVDTFNPYTAAALTGFSVTCSQFQACRLDADDTTPFTLTFVITL
jgi:hypothetical protein